MRDGRLRVGEQTCQTSTGGRQYRAPTYIVASACKCNGLRCHCALPMHLCNAPVPFYLLPQLNFLPTTRQRQHPGARTSFVLVGRTRLFYKISSPESERPAGERRVSRSNPVFLSSFSSFSTYLLVVSRWQFRQLVIVMAKARPKSKSKTKCCLRH